MFNGLFVNLSLKTSYILNTNAEDIKYIYAKTVTLKLTSQPLPMTEIRSIIRYHGTFVMKRFLNLSLLPCKTLMTIIQRYFWQWIMIIPYHIIESDRSMFLNGYGTNKKNCSFNSSDLNYLFLNGKRPCSLVFIWYLLSLKKPKNDQISSEGNVYFFSKY